MLGVILAWSPRPTEQLDLRALDPADPYRSMARAYSRIFICRGGRQEDYIEEMVESSFEGFLPRGEDLSQQINTNTTDAAATAERMGMRSSSSHVIGKPAAVF
jgi:hypothetical protein